MAAVCVDIVFFNSFLYFCMRHGGLQPQALTFPPFDQLTRTTVFFINPWQCKGGNILCKEIATFAHVKYIVLVNVSHSLYLLKSSRS